MEAPTPGAAPGRMLTQEEAAALLGLKCANTLAVWRSTRRYDLPFYKVGRAVRYLEADVLAFLHRRRVA